MNFPGFLTSGFTPGETFRMMQRISKTVFTDCGGDFRVLSSTRLGFRRFSERSIVLSASWMERTKFRKIMKKIMNSLLLNQVIEIRA